MRKAALAVVALAIAVGGPVLALAGGNDAAGKDRGQAPAALRWAGEPIAVEPDAGLEDDHILVGRLRNTSLRPAELDVERVRVLDREGRPLKTAARFAHAFAHGIYSHEMVFRGGPPTDFERRRLGEIATVKPGADVPLTVSWRGDGAAAIELGGARVPLPGAS